MKVSAWEKQARRDSLITDLKKYGYGTTAYALYSRGDCCVVRRISGMKPPVPQTSHSWSTSSF
jgi:hypothetical protein